MPEGRIILARHGETEANRSSCFAVSDDIPLTSLGMEQAKNLAILLQEQFLVSRVFTSPFLRARQTGATIAGQLGVPWEVLDGVHERNFGVLKGLPYKRMGVMMKEDLDYDPERRWEWIPPGGESLNMVQQRAISVLTAVHLLHPDEDLVIVSHGAVMESVIAHVNNEWSSAQVPANCGILVIEHVHLCGNLREQPQPAG